MAGSKALRATKRLTGLVRRPPRVRGVRVLYQPDQEGVVPKSMEQTREGRGEGKRGRRDTGGGGIVELY